MWSAEIPVTTADLTAEELERASRSKLPLAMAGALHRRAVELGRDTYVDPSTRYTVFSRLYLARRPCCGNGCRHCPYGHVNVQKPGAETGRAETGRAKGREVLAACDDW
jgi:hypothetical protein